MMMVTTDGRVGAVGVKRKPEGRVGKGGVVRGEAVSTHYKDLTFFL
jgi:hypothetical protein